MPLRRQGMILAILFDSGALCVDLCVVLTKVPAFTRTGCYMVWLVGIQCRVLSAHSHIFLSVSLVGDCQLCSARIIHCNVDDGLNHPCIYCWPMPRLLHCNAAHMSNLMTNPTTSCQFPPVKFYYLSVVSNPPPSPPPLCSSFMRS